MTKVDICVSIDGDELIEAILDTMDCDDIVDMFKTIESELEDGFFTKGVLVEILRNLYVDGCDVKEILGDDMEWIAGMFA
jgi:hypothetical protein